MNALGNALKQRLYYLFPSGKSGAYLYCYFDFLSNLICDHNVHWYTEDFQNVRTFIKNKLQSALSGSGLLPPTSQINIFGSSQNNFGSENADCDMCISYPGCEEVGREDKVCISFSIHFCLEIYDHVTNIDTTSPLTCPPRAC